MDPLSSTLVVSQTVTDRMQAKKGNYSTELAKAISVLPPFQQMLVETKLNEIYCELKEQERLECIRKWEALDNQYLCLFRLEPHEGTLNEWDDHNIDDHWFSSLEDMAHYVYKWLDSHKELAVMMSKEGDELEFKRAQRGLVRYESITKAEFIAYWVRKNQEDDCVRFEHRVTGGCDIGYVMIEFHRFNQNIQVEPNTYIYL